MWQFRSVQSCGLARRGEWNATTGPASLLDLGLAVHGTRAAQNASTTLPGNVEGSMLIMLIAARC